MTVLQGSSERERSEICCSSEETIVAIGRWLKYGEKAVAEYEDEYEEGGGGGGLLFMSVPKAEGALMIPPPPRPLRRVGTINFDAIQMVI